MTQSSMSGIKTTNAVLTVAFAAMVVMNVAIAPAQDPQMKMGKTGYLRCLGYQTVKNGWKWV